MAIPIELWQAKSLRMGDIVYALGFYENSGEPQKYVVTFAPRTWKRNKARVEVSLCRGQECIVMTELCLDEFSLDEPDHIRKPIRKLRT